MNDEARPRDFRDAVEAFLTEQRARADYQRSQWHATRQARADANGPHSLEFDESGFPIPQRRPGLAERVARLLGTS